MKKRSSYVIFSVIGAVVIILLAQSLNYFLSISSFKKNAETALISRYQVFLQESVDTIELGLTFGKPLSQFSGMEGVLSTALENYGSQGLREIHITDNDGFILYSSREGIGGWRSTVEIPSTQSTESQNLPQAFLLVRPLYLGDDPVGSIQMEYSMDLLNRQVDRMGRQVLTFMGVGILGVTLLLILLLFGLERTKGKGHSTLGKTKVKRSTFLLILVLLFSLSGFGFVNMQQFRNELRSTFHDTVQVFGESEQAKIEQALAYGIPLDRLLRLEELQRSRLESVDACRSISVVDEDWRLLYYSTAERGYSILNEAPMPTVEVSEYEQITIPLTHGGEELGLLILEVNGQMLQKAIWELIKDMVTIIVVCLVFSFEVLALISMMLYRSQQDSIKPEFREQAEQDNGIRIIRVTSFLFYLGAFMPLAFLPMFIDSVTGVRSLVPITGLPIETLLTLPISSFMFGSMLFVPLVGILSKRLSISRLLIINGFIYLFGALLSAYAYSNLYLTIARFICGLGYGGTMMSIVSLVMQYTTQKNRATGFGVFTAASASAGFCAIAIGGLFAGRFGYRAAMVITAVISALYLLFILLHNLLEKDSKLKVVETSDSLDSWKDFFVVFRNRKLFATLFFSALPYQLIVVGLFQYLFPLYMNNIGVGEGDIGRILTIFSITGLLIPAVSRISDRTGHRKLFIILGNIITGAGLMIFMLNERLLAFAAVITIVGIGTILVDAVTEALVTDVPEAHALGETKMLSIFTMYSKILAVVTPLIIGGLTMAIGNRHTIVVIGVFTLISSLLYMVTTLGKSDSLKGEST